LGNTIEQIAWEKGGIFAIEKASLEHVSPFPVSKSDGSNNGNTSNDTLYVMDSNSSVGIAMLQSCARIEGQGKSIFLVNANGGLYSKISLGLAGQHQYGNANLAVHLCRALFPSKVFDNSNTLKGLADASWPGRCQLLPNHNLTLCLDGAHTVDSMQAVVDWYSKLTDATRGGKLVFTCSHERNPIELLLLLKKLNFQDVYFCSADTHRPSPLDIPKANELLKDHGIQASFDESEATWQETLATIWRKISHPSERQRIHVGGTASTVVKDLDNFRGHVLVTGSLYLVGSFLTAMKWSEESSPHSLRHV
jgi:folylpolyglutamate synthase